MDDLVNEIKVEKQNLSKTLTALKKALKRGKKNNCGISCDSYLSS